MEQHTIIRLTERPEYKESMAQWFHEKWGIPKQAYLDSMDACLKGESAGSCLPMTGGSPGISC